MFRLVLLLCITTSIFAREPLSEKGWQLTTATDTEAVLSGPGGVRVRFAGLTPDAKVDMMVAPDARHVAILARHRKVTEIMIYGLTATGELREVAVPLIPANSILDQFPRAGKPAGKRFRLDDMNVQRAGWGGPDKFAVTVQLGLTEETEQDPNWCYVVDAVFTVSEAPAASIALLNVAFQRLGAP